MERYEVFSRARSEGKFEELYKAENRAKLLLLLDNTLLYATILNLETREETRIFVE